MPVTFTATTRVKDWQQLTQMNREALFKLAQRAGARTVRVLRGLHDPSRALVIAELPDQDAVCEWCLALEEHLAPALAEAQLDARAWEAISMFDSPL